MRQHPKAPRGKRGQALVEYVITAGLLLACVGMMALLLYTFKAHGNRVMSLIAFDHP